MEQRSSVNGKNVLKFLLFSAFGVLMFLVPIPQGILLPHCWIF